MNYVICREGGSPVQILWRIQPIATLSFLNTIESHCTTVNVTGTVRNTGLWRNINTEWRIWNTSNIGWNVIEICIILIKNTWMHKKHTQKKERKKNYTDPGFRYGPERWHTPRPSQLNTLVDIYPCYPLRSLRGKTTPWRGGPTCTAANEGHSNCKKTKKDAKNCQVRFRLKSPKNVTSLNNHNTMMIIMIMKNLVLTSIEMQYSI